MTLQLQWIKSRGNTWSNFETLDLQSVGDVTGVYIIWQGKPPPNIILVGRGNIAERLAAHRADPAILEYRSSGLFVTWARVDPSQAAGVEAFLAQSYKPLIEHKFSDQTPIPVSFPA